MNPKGFEGDRTEQSEAQTVRWTVCRESDYETLSYEHAATDEQEVFSI